MPGSTLGYGHDTHGVNIQNLRSLTEGPTRQLGRAGLGSRSGQKTIQEWKRETKEALALASNENYMSRSLRVASKKLQDQLKAKAEKDLSRVDKALRSKIGKTEHLKGVLEVAIASVKDERTKLLTSRNRLLRKIQKMSRQLNVCKARVKIRNDRPNREIVNDKVHLQLHRQTGLLQSYLERLHNGVKTANLGIARLEQCDMTLTSDLHDKASALDLDTQVLEGDFSKGQAPRNSMGDAQGLHPHNWCQSTDDIVKNANKWSAESCRVRHELTKLMAERDAAAHECSAALNLAMIDKLNETDESRQSLQQKYAETKKEMEDAVQRKSALQKSLEDKKAPTLQAMHRLLLRKQRPHRERVDDEAHKALVTELRNLTTISSQLQDKIKAMNREIRHLEDKMRMIDENLQGKSASWKVDEQCIMLDGRVSVSRCPSSVGASVGGSIASQRSVASDRSVRSDIMARITQLEKELTLARQDRIGMEATVQKLQDEVSEHPFG